MSRRPVKGWSKYTDREQDLRADKLRDGPVHGAAIHTSGRGVYRKNENPDHVALDFYANSKYSTHYMVGVYRTVQLTNDFERVQHIGFTGTENDYGGAMNGTQRRRWYLSGQWEKEMPPVFVKRWKERHPGKKSPAHLYPSRWPNDDFVAIEFVPGTPLAKPLRPGLWYSLAQHAAGGVILADLGLRHGWPYGSFVESRVVTHEDVGPHSRATKRGGWDPGILRANPRMCWPTIMAWAQMALVHGIGNTFDVVEGLYSSDHS